MYTILLYYNRHGRYMIIIIHNAVTHTRINHCRRGSVTSFGANKGRWSGRPRVPAGGGALSEE